MVGFFTERGLKMYPAITLHIDGNPIMIFIHHIVAIEKNDGYTEITLSGGLVLGVDEDYDYVTKECFT